MTEYLNVGKLVNTQGIKGEVRVISQTDFPDARFAVGNTLYLFMERQPQPIPLVVKSHRLHKNFQLLTFVNHPSINDVEKYKGGTLKVDVADLNDELYEDEFYYHEIIGLKVVDETQRELGEVTEILATGANDVWVVKAPGKKEWYLPYIDDVVKGIDLEKGVVNIEMMEGLLDED